MNATLQRHISELLAELGANVPAIAMELERREIQGVPGVPDACPIARYLKTRDVPVNFVTALRIEVRGDDYDIPAVIADFVCAFDDDPDDFPGIVEVQS